jgi:hypothetical protein
MWTQQQKLTASDAAAEDQFGFSVAISGDYIVVGAPEDSDVGSESGSAYVFKRTGESWAQQQKLNANDEGTRDQFGVWVAISGETVVVGSPDSHNLGGSRGAGYVYVRSGSTWSEQQKLTSDDNHSLGSPVAIDGNTIVLAAPYDSREVELLGAAYVFTRPLAITCPANITVSGDPGQCSAVVTFAPSVSDPGADIVCNPPSGSAFPVGMTTVNCVATDASSNQSACYFSVTVNDTEPPIITTIATPIKLWPPNHMYQTINLANCIVSVTDNCNGLDVNSVVITKVTSDEPEDAPGSDDGNTLSDIVIAANCKTLQLRAERQSNGNGRVYTIYLRVTDASGNVGLVTCKVMVTVDRDGNPAIDDGPIYTVTSNCQ